jgi:hypothetical protein
MWMRCLAVLLLLAPISAHARQLDVGPDRELKAPSAAARIAADGDVIRIDPGEYFDCAFWRANRLTVEGAADGVVVTDVACAGKAAFVVDGNDITIRGITFTRVRVGDGNGAGIRAEGRGIMVENSRFINNQVGLLAADMPGGAIIVRDSEFIDNGACNERTCVGALLTGAASLLEITHSHFSGTKGGHQIVSAADAMVMTDSTVEDGPQGSSSYLMMHTGPGSVLLQGNTLEKGASTTNPRAAVLLDAPMGEQGPLVFRANHFINDTGSSANFIVNWTSGHPVLDGNKLASGDTELTSWGLWRHRSIVFAVHTKDDLRHLAGKVGHPVLDALHKLKSAL